MDIEQIALEALKAAYQRQVKLSSEGTIGFRISKGSGGDTSLRGDIESEQEVIRILKENNFPAKVFAEEHGEICLAKNPEYLVVIDGFDGSSALAKDNKARGGTMLAVADNLNPRYKDFIFGGITDFSTDRIVFGGDLSKGVFLNKYLNSRLKDWKKMENFPVKYFSSQTRIHVDDPKYVGNYEEGITLGLDEISEVVRKNFTSKLEGRVKLSGLISSGGMCMDLIVGEVDAIGGISAKGIFEQPAEYPLLKELGGTIVGYSGEDIGNNFWFEDRLNHRNNPVPSLRASSKQLSEEIISYLNSFK